VALLYQSGLLWNWAGLKVVDPMVIYPNFAGYSRSTWMIQVNRYRAPTSASRPVA